MKLLVLLLTLGTSLIFAGARSDHRMVPATSKIPKKIWQTYKTKQLSYPAREAQSTWLKKNPKYEYIFFDDEDIEKYIRNQWDDRTLAFFKALPVGAMKADLWRYLIVTTEGGVYSDIDSVCCREITSWPTKVPKHANDVLILGMEPCGWFCQWTIASTKQHPAMQYVCEYVINYYFNHGIDLNRERFVIFTTGPGIWSDALSSYMGVSNLSVPQIYDRYCRNRAFKNHVNKLGIWIEPISYYNGKCSQNLFGSLTFGDGYISWVTEQNRLKEEANKQIK